MYAVSAGKAVLGMKRKRREASDLSGEVETKGTTSESDAETESDNNTEEGGDADSASESGRDGFSSESSEDARPNGGVRRSGRKRFNRVVLVGQDSILKSNNYTMENGEKSVLDGEAGVFGLDMKVQQQVKKLLRDNVKVLTNYQLFAADCREGCKSISRLPGQDPLKPLSAAEIGAAWNNLDLFELAKYTAKADALRDKAAALKEKYDRQVRLEMENAIQTKKAAAMKEQAQRRREERRRKKQRKKASLKRTTQMRAKNARAGTSSIRETVRNQQNKLIKESIDRRKQMQLRFMARHKRLFEPFLTPKVLSTLPQLTKQDIIGISVHT